MKVASQVSNNNGLSAKRRFDPPIPMERPVQKEPATGECQTHKLRTQPAQENSAECDLQIAHFSSGTCEEWLKFREKLMRVLKGQNVKEGRSMFAVARGPLGGEALTAFNDCQKRLDSHQKNTFEACLDEVTELVFPLRAAFLQKRHMRHFPRKP